MGVDLHKQHHVAVIINCWQEKLDEIKFENKPSAFSTFLLDIYKHMDDGLTPILGLEDVNAIAKNTGFSVVRIQRIKDHVFNNSHIKDHEVGRFDPDYELAQAW